MYRDEKRILICQLQNVQKLVFQTISRSYHYVLSCRINCLNSDLNCTVAPVSTRVPVTQTTISKFSIIWELAGLIRGRVKYVIVQYVWRQGLAWYYCFHKLISQRFSGEHLGSFFAGSVPDPDPPDPHVFGPPGSRSTSQR